MSKIIKPIAKWQIVSLLVAVCVILVVIILTQIDINSKYQYFETDGYFEVSGYIVRVDGRSTGVCSLVVHVVDGYPVGEMAEIIPAGKRFAWKLRRGSYDLMVMCEETKGALRVNIANQNQTDLIIVTL